MIRVLQPQATLGILGMPGSGKSLLAGLLKRSGVPVVRLGGFVVAELDPRGLPHTPAGEAVVRRDLRREEGLDVLAKRAAKWIEGHSAHTLFVLDGVYSPDEDDYFRRAFERFYFTLSVVCNRSERYERLAHRDHRPLSSSEAAERDRNELSLLRKSDPIVMADYFVTNNDDPHTFLTASLSTIFRRTAALNPGDMIESVSSMPVERLTSAIAAGEFFEPEIRWIVLARAQLESDPHLMWFACRMLGELGDPLYEEFLLETGKRPDVRLDDTSLHLISAWALGKIGAMSASLEPLLSQRNPEYTRRFAVDALGEIGNPASLDSLLRALREDESDSVANWAALSITKVAEDRVDRSRAINELTILLRQLPTRRAYIVFDALSRLDPSAADAVRQSVEHPIPAELAELIEHAHR